MKRDIAYYAKNDVIFIDSFDGAVPEVAFIGCSHIDSPMTNRNALKRCLDKAKERGALICFNGDNNDLMQGRNDPRRKSYMAAMMDYPSFRDYMKKRRNESGEFDTVDEKIAYTDWAVDMTIDFLKPYAENIMLIGMGNHESSAIKNLNTDVAARVAQGLRDYSESPVYKSGLYSVINLRMGKRDKDRESPAAAQTMKIFMTHDGGACGFRSKGILMCDIIAGKYPDCNMFVVAHTHEKWTYENKSTITTSHGILDWPDRHFFMSPSFKEEWKDKTRLGWWIERNMGPRAVGGYIIQFEKMTRDGVDVIDVQHLFVR